MKQYREKKEKQYKKETYQERSKKSQDRERYHKDSKRTQELKSDQSATFESKPLLDADSFDHESKKKKMLLLKSLLEVKSYLKKAFHIVH